MSKSESPLHPLLNDQIMEYPEAIEFSERIAVDPNLSWAVGVLGVEQLSSAIRSSGGFHAEVMQEVIHTPVPDHVPGFNEALRLIGDSVYDGYVVPEMAKLGIEKNHLTALQCLLVLDFFNLWPRYEFLLPELMSHPDLVEKYHLDKATMQKLSETEIINPTPSPLKIIVRSHSKRNGFELSKDLITDFSLLAVDALIDSFSTPNQNFKPKELISALVISNMDHRFTNEVPNRLSYAAGLAKDAGHPELSEFIDQEVDRLKGLREYSAKFHSSQNST